jgi:hypothetical protein
LCQKSISYSIQTPWIIRSHVHIWHFCVFQVPQKLYNDDVVLRHAQNVRNEHLIGTGASLYRQEAGRGRTISCILPVLLCRGPKARGSVGRSTVREVSAHSSGSSAGMLVSSLSTTNNSSATKVPTGSRAGSDSASTGISPTVRAFALLPVTSPARERGFDGVVGLANTSRVENVCTTDERFRIAVHARRACCS